MKSILTRILKYDILLLTVITFLSRLPQLLSENLFVDGDECIVGLMAKHFIEGKELPFFFYGQSYGFSFLEIIPIGLFYKVFGVSILAVKLAMLTLFSLGIVYFYKTLQNLDSESKFTPLLLTLILIFSPAYALWAMKARGGYMTAFVYTFVVTYLASKKNDLLQPAKGLLIGLFLVIIYQSQPLWLAGLIPLLVVLNFKKKPVVSFLFQAVGILAGTIIFYFIKQDLSEFWTPPVIDISSINIDWILSIPRSTFIYFTGSYDYGDFIEPNQLTQALSYVMTASTLILIIGVTYKLIQSKERNYLMLASLASVLMTIGYLIFLNNSTPRYIMPLLGFLLILGFLFVSKTENKLISNTISILIVILGIPSMISFKNYSYANNKDEMILNETLQKDGIEYVFCEGGLTQWKIMFNSQEKVIARFVHNTDRYPKYIGLVNEALEASKGNVALVGYYNEAFVESSPNCKQVGDIYFVYDNPSKELLKERGFKFE